MISVKAPQLADLLDTALGPVFSPVLPTIKELRKIGRLDNPGSGRGGSTLEVDDIAAVLVAALSPVTRSELGEAFGWIDTMPNAFVAPYDLPNASPTSPIAAVEAGITDFDRFFLDQVFNDAFGSVSPELTVPETQLPSWHDDGVILTSFGRVSSSCVAIRKEKVIDFIGVGLLEFKHCYPERPSFCRGAASRECSIWILPVLAALLQGHVDPLSIFKDEEQRLKALCRDNLPARLKKARNRFTQQMDKARSKHG